MHSWITVSNGTNASLAIRSDYTLWGWGYNTNYEVTPDTYAKSSPVQIGTDSSWISVSAGNTTMFAIKQDYTLWAWGIGTAGQLGDNTIITKSSPVQIFSIHWRQIGGGISHTVALKSDGTLWAWGLNSTGQLGDGTTISKSSPIQIGTRTDWAYVAKTHHSSTFALTYGSVQNAWTWGDNTNGILGDSTTAARSSPVQISTGLSIVQVAAGLMIDTTGFLYSWGANNNGQLGDNTTVARSSPVRVGALATWTQLPSPSNQSENSFAIKNDGTLWGWGNNTYGAVGTLDTISRSSPVQIGAYVEPAMVVCHYINTHILATNGLLYGIGYNAAYVLGDNTTINRSQPTQVGGNFSWKSIAAGNYCGRAIRSDGTLWVWGNNTYGELGTNDTNTRLVPMQVGQNTNWIKTFNGATGNALTSDYTLYVWGSNNYGQLGDGTTANKSSPVQLPGSWTLISGPYSDSDGTATTNTTAGIKTDGTLWVWGSDISGQLAQVSSTVHRSSPVQVMAGVSSFSQVSVGQTHVLALTTAGTLLTWGNNAYGQIGDNTVVSKSSPVGVTGGGTWKYIAAGATTSYGIKTDGTMYAWGNNPWGQVGDNTVANRSSPTQIGTSNNWRTVISTASHAIASNTLNQWFGWGRNDYGQAGDGTTNYRSSPVQLATLSPVSFTQVGMIGEQTVGALTSIGTVYTWGNGENYMTGQGDTTSRSKPVQILAGYSVAAIGGAALTGSTTAGYAITKTGSVFGWGTNDGNVFVNSATTLSLPTLVGTALSTNAPYYNHFMNKGGLFFTDSQRKTYVMGANTNGALGDGTTVSRSSPVQLGTEASSSWISVSSGGSVTVGVTSDGKLLTWGDNSIYQLAQGDNYNRSAPVQIKSSVNFSKAVVSQNPSGTMSFALAIDTNNKLWGWGNNPAGQLTMPTYSNVRFAVTGASDHMLYISDTGANPNTLWTWGNNNVGQLGVNDITTRSSPVVVPGSWSSVSAGYSYTAAIKTDGSLWTWGYSANGNLGFNNTIYRSAPVQLGGSSWSMVTTGETTLAITSDGKLFSWGYNSAGAFGDNSANGIYRSSPVQITTDTSWTFVTCNATHVLGIKKDGTLWAWGNNVYGQLGDGTTTYRSSPVQIMAGKSWLTVLSTTSLMSYGLDNTNKLWGWGLNSYSQLGQNDILPRSTPVQVMASKTFVAFDGNTTSLYAVANDGTMWAAGNNAQGQIGDLSTVNRSTPVQVGVGVYWTDVRTPALSVIAKDASNRIYTWGYGATGQLGNNTTVIRSSPVQIASGIQTLLNNPIKISDSSWTMVTAGNNQVVAIKADGTLWAWGANTSNEATVATISAITGGLLGSGILMNDGTFYMASSVANGQMGDGLAAGAIRPRIALNNYNGQRKYSSIVVKPSTAYAIDTTGKIISAGDNIYGELGDGTTISRSNAIQIGNSSWNVVDASAYGSATVAIRSDGTLWAWGFNQYGQFGSSAYSQASMYSSPVQVGTSSWSQLSVGDQFTLALKADSTLWAWGYNAWGQLGQGYVNTNSTYSWSKIATYWGTSYAIRSDGMLFAWGGNAQGQVGDGTTIYRSAPIQISNSSFSQISAGGSFATALTTTGKIFAWGYNAYGQLGDSTIASRYTPAEVGYWSDTSPYTNISTQAGGWVVQRGNNAYGFSLNSNQGYYMGFGDTNYRYTPGLISNQYVSVAVGPIGTLAIDTSGRIIATGAYPGDGTASTISPVIVPAVYPATSWVSLMANSNQVVPSLTHNGAIDNLGRFFVWGSSNAYLFNSGIVSENLYYPREWKPGTSFTQVAANYQNIYAITNTGQLFSIGSGSGGAIGDNTVTTKLSPTLIPAAAGTSWTRVGVTQGFTAFAINSLGQLFGWGIQNASYGFVGDNSTVPRSSPVQIGIGTSFTNIFTGNTQVFAKTTTGTIFGWGVNSYAELGDGTTIDRSSPVQIGTSSWTTVASGWRGTMGIINGNLYMWGTPGYSGFRPYNGLASMSGYWSTTTGGYVLTSPVQITTYNSTAYSWSAVSSGDSHTAAIRSDGTVWSWGRNDLSQLATPYSTTDSNYISSPVPLVGGGSWTQVSVGTYHTLGIKTDGTVWGWGSNESNELTNDANRISWIWATGGGGVKSNGTLWMTGTNLYGELGVGDTINRSSHVQVGTDTNWKQVEWSGNYSAAGDSAHALKTNGVLYGWGNNIYGSIGDGTTINKSSPVQVSGGLTVSRFYATENGESVYAITTDNRMFVWGWNLQGQLGLGDTLNRSSPVQLPGSWSMIKATTSNVAAINTIGQLFVWGSNTYGQIGDSTVVAKSSPVQAGVGSSWAMVAATHWATAAIDINGRLLTWGGNLTYGQLGDGTTTSRSSPVQVGTSSWTQIFSSAPASGYGTFYGFQYDVSKMRTSLYAWGRGDFGLIGEANTVSRSSPTQVAPLGLKISPIGYYNAGWAGPAFSAVQFADSTGGIQAAFTDIDGTFYRWGLNQSGQLGDSTTVVKSSPIVLSAGNLLNNTFNLSLGMNTLVSSPVQISSLTGSFIQVKAGGGADAGSWGGGYAGGSSAAIRNDNTLWVWGDNTSNQLPLAYTTSFRLTGGVQNTLILKTDGQLLTVGLGTGGAIGDNTAVTKSSWVLISAGGKNRNWIDAAAAQANTAGTQFMLAIKSDYKLYTWGYNGNGGLGLGDVLSRSSPTQVGTSSWTKVAAASNAGYAIKVDGTLWGWGYNAWGQLGQSDTVDRSSPVQIAGSYTNIWAGGSHVVALKTDGTYWAWGANSLGQLGLNDVASRSAPAQVSTFVSPAVISVGYATNAYIDNLGKLWGWGYDSYGTLGQGATANRSSPVQIGVGKSWIQVGIANTLLSGILIDNTLWSMGSTPGDGTTTNRSSPVQVGAGTSFYQLYAAYSSMYVAPITQTQTAPQTKLQGWGGTTAGDLGDATLVPKSSPVAVLSSSDSNAPINIPTPIQIAGSWTQIALNQNLNQYATAGFGVQADGTLWTWGMNVGGQLGTGDTIYKPNPVKIGTATNWSLAAGSASNAMILNTSGQLFSMGTDAVGTLGQGITTNRSSPVQVNTGMYMLDPVQIPGSWSMIRAADTDPALGPSDFAMAMRTDGTVYAWGKNVAGQLGQNDTNPRSSPVQIPGSYISIGAGVSSAAGIKTNNTLWTWGDNQFNQLAQNDSTNRSSPTQVGVMDNYKKVFMGAHMFVTAMNNPTNKASEHQLLVAGRGLSYSQGVGNVTNLAILTVVDNSITYDQQGANLGQLTLIGSSAITQLSTTSWNSISSGINTNSAIRSDGTLWAWGYNNYGQVGDGTTTNRVFPILVSGVSTTVVSTGQLNTIAIQTADPLTGARLVAVGYGGQGQLGDNTAIGKSSIATVYVDSAYGTSSPVQISSYSYSNYYKTSPIQLGTNSWSAVSAGDNYTLAKDTSSLLFAWGYNAFGQVGNNTTINTSSPVQVSTSTWSQIYAGYSHSSVINTNKNAYTFGSNSNSQLGDGT